MRVVRLCTSLCAIFLLAGCARTIEMPADIVEPCADSSQDASTCLGSLSIHLQGDPSYQVDTAEVSVRARNAEFPVSRSNNDPAAFVTTKVPCGLCRIVVRIDRRDAKQPRRYVIEATRCIMGQQTASFDLWLPE